MTNINFHLRSLTEKTPQSIWAVFYIENIRIRIDTNQQIKPSDWSKDKKKALSSFKECDKLNKLLKEQSQFIENFIENLKLKKKRFYKDELQTEFNRHFKIGENLPKAEGDVVDFISFIEKYISQRKDLAGGTIKNIVVTKKHIFYCFNLVPINILNKWKTMNKKEKREAPEFLKASKQIDFDMIDYKWMQEFHAYLLHATFTEAKNGVKEVKSYSKNFIAKQIKNIKLICNAAVAAGYIHNLSFRGFKASYEDADNIHLSWDEISMIKNLELDPHSTLGKIRNLFVFNCYLGLRYSDLSRLNQNSFTTYREQMYLRIRMKKTDDIVNFPILKSAEKIMKIYDYKLPIISEPNFNEEIKKICLKSGITNLETKRETRGGTKLILTLPKYEMVSSHTARRSFATNFYEDGVSIRELMAVTGHTTEGSFKNYVRSKTITEFTEFLAVGANR